MLERQKKNLRKIEENSPSKFEAFIVKVIYVILFIAYNLFEIWLVYLIGKYQGKTHEMIFLVVCFMCNKSIYGTPLHFRDNIKCLVISLFTFYVAGSCTIGFETSILVSIIIGVACGSITSYVATYLLKEEMKKETKRSQIIKILGNDLSKEHIIKQVKESIRLLNCDYLDILLLHRPDALVDYEEVNEAFNYLYDNGLVKSFGVSNMNVMQIELYNKYLTHKIKHNQVQFSIVHSHLISEGVFVNMSENESPSRSGGMIEYAMLKDISLQAWSPVMATWKDGTFIDNPKYEKVNLKLEELANKYNVCKNAIAIAFILRHPANIIPVVGTTSIIHLEEMLKGKDIILTKEEWYSLYLSAGHILP